MQIRNLLLLSYISFLCVSCGGEAPLFLEKTAAETGITFANNITTTDSFNALFFEYIYNGGGVAAADFNNDGLCDLFFTGNQVSNELYLNTGDLQFEAVTEAAGLQSSKWCTGVAVVDINEDGKKDIYVAVAGFETSVEEMENLLFINQGWDAEGVPTFKEEAANYGLNDSGYSTQAAFLDYDRDGDLDLYLLTNAMESFNRNNIRPRRVNGEAASTDRLYRNNGDQTFTDISREAGILIEGYGLGVKVADINLDGWPDIYAANDFQSNDLLWINQQDGTFKNEASIYLKHQTHNGMGVDIADFNNDGLPDITVLDMLPEDNYRQKMMIPHVSQEKFLLKQQEGYEDQYMRNTVQLHQGFDAAGLPRFSEIGFLTGMANTDWSWSILYADLDNDGWKDAFITNGYRKDVTNLDYINYSGLNQIFGTVEARRQKAVEDLANAPDVEVTNYLFRNRGSLQFEQVNESWGIDQPSFSNGSVYVDLDNDGDLELVVNNIDSPASLYENTASTRATPGHYLQVRLRESSPDLTTLQTKIKLHTSAGIQYQEFSPQAGYKSNLADLVHFGLGEQEQIDSLVVIWPDGNHQMIAQPAADQLLIIDYEKSSGVAQVQRGNPTQPLFQEAAKELGLVFQHQDNHESHLRTQRTKIHDHAKLGPAIAIGDLNGDGHSDVFLGGNVGQAAQLFFQTSTSSFISQSFPLDSYYQDISASLFDLEGDGDLDLYADMQHQQVSIGDRLYLNDGQGNFVRSPTSLPKMTGWHNCVRAADYDQDGDIDLFVGGRLEPGTYPKTPRSYLLENRDGKLVDNTPSSLQQIGMVTDAQWLQSSDSFPPDLVVVGEWMSPTIIKNKQGQLNKAESLSTAAPGWWTHLNILDLDQDGDQDFLLGNWGWNHKLKASPKEPVRLYAADFDENGTMDPLLSCFIQGQDYIMHERDLLIAQIPGMKRRFPQYDKYAQAGLAQTLSKKDLGRASILESQTMSSALLMNQSDAKFELKELSEEFQLSPIMGSVSLDINADGLTDLITAGNFHATETTQIGCYDASYGQIALQTENGEWQSSTALQFGMNLDGDVRGLASLQLANGQIIILAPRYNGALAVYRYSPGPPVQPL